VRHLVPVWPSAQTRLDHPLAKGFVGVTGRRSSSRQFRSLRVSLTRPRAMQNRPIGFGSSVPVKSNQPADGLDIRARDTTTVCSVGYRRLPCQVVATQPRERPAPHRAAEAMPRNGNQSRARVSRWVRSQEQYRMDASKTLADRINLHSRFGHTPVSTRTNEYRSP